MVMRSTLERHQGPLFYAGAALVSLYAGTVAARQQHGISMLLVALVGLTGIAVLVSIPVEWLFIGWLFLAPIFQTSADKSTIGGMRR